MEKNAALSQLTAREVQELRLLQKAFADVFNKKLAEFGVTDHAMIFAHLQTNSLNTRPGRLRKIRMNLRTS